MNLLIWYVKNKVWQIVPCASKISEQLDVSKSWLKVANSYIEVAVAWKYLKENKEDSSVFKTFLSYYFWSLFPRVWTQTNFTNWTSIIHTLQHVEFCIVCSLNWLYNVLCNDWVFFFLVHFYCDFDYKQTLPGVHAAWFAEALQGSHTCITSPTIPPPAIACFHPCQQSNKSINAHK